MLMMLDSGNEEPEGLSGREKVSVGTLFDQLALILRDDTNLALFWAFSEQAMPHLCEHAIEGFLIFVQPKVSADLFHFLQ